MKDKKKSMPKGMKPSMGRSGPDDKGNGVKHTPMPMRKGAKGK